MMMKEVHVGSHEKGIRHVIYFVHAAGVGREMFIALLGGVTDPGGSVGQAHLCP